jgi:hypothetical protein
MYLPPFPSLKLGAPYPLPIDHQRCVAALRDKCYQRGDSTSVLLSHERECLRGVSTTLATDELQASAGSRSPPAALLHPEGSGHALAPEGPLIIALMRHADPDRPGDHGLRCDPMILARRPGRDSPSQCFLRVWTSSA